MHQGDLDGIKGVYHITCVDASSQWQVEACVQAISEAFLLPVLAWVIAQFPFEIEGFHSDNGSEYVNATVAKMLEKLRIEQTKSRSRHSNDNALPDIEWIQAGVNEPGRKEKVLLKLPDGIQYRNVPDNSLNEMLRKGELDAVMSARPPVGMGQGIARLMPDSQAAEVQYFKDTNIFPVMHALVLKGPVLDAHPWVAMNLYKTFLEAKNRSMERLSDVTASHAPMAWMADYTEGLRGIFGDDFYPYGIGPGRGGDINRATLEAFLKFGFEQGVCHRPLAVDELFPKQVLGSYKV